MNPQARLTLGDDPETFFIIDEGEFILGRSEECDIRINDRYVSRRQARIYFSGGRYVLENVGSNPVLANGGEVKTHLLSHNDRVTVGKTELLFQLEGPQPDAAQDIAVAEEIIDETSVQDGTVLISETMVREHGPRLLVTAPGGQMKTVPVDTETLIIGRSAEADLRLDDPRVSRKHCRLQKIDERIIATRLSDINALFVNDEPVTEKPLFSGDQIQIGPFILSFFSDRPEDLRPVEKRVVSKARGLSIAAWVVVFSILLALSTFVFHSRIYTPWKVRQALEEISQQIESGAHSPAREALTRLLAADLPARESQKALELFSHSTFLQARQMLEAGNLKEARSFLITFLNTYGGSDHSRTLQDQLDVCRLELGRHYEESGDQLAALQEFSAITEESPHFDQAQQAVSRIWLAYQQQDLGRESITQLMLQAEEHFLARRYTTPITNNAYVIYQTVLSVDPQNGVAQQRIEQMKIFYLENGERYLQQKNYAAALSYFERYLLIDPLEREVREKVAVCRKNISRKASPQRGRASRTEAQEDRQQEKVKRLFEGAGTEPSPAIGN